MVDLLVPKRSTMLHRDFFERYAETVAQDLLGRVFVHERTGQSPLYLALTEVAAYEGFIGSDEEAAQRKNSSLFYAPGVLGLSTSHGKHLIDIGTDELCAPSCVTLVGGILFDNRGQRDIVKGPGNLSRALGIDKTFDLAPLNYAGLWIGGDGVDSDTIKQRQKSSVPENCKGYFYI